MVLVLDAAEEETAVLPRVLAAAPVAVVVVVLVAFLLRLPAVAVDCLLATDALALLTVDLVERDAVMLDLWLRLLLR